MGYHAINEGGTTTVYRYSDANQSYILGKLYNGEAFIVINDNSSIKTIMFLNSAGKNEMGYVTYVQAGPLNRWGQYLYATGLGYCYRFKLRHKLPIVDGRGNSMGDLEAGSYIYCSTTSDLCGESNWWNLKIIGYYIPGGNITKFDGFITLNYTYGSMFSKNFCLEKA